MPSKRPRWAYLFLLGGIPPKEAKNFEHPSPDMDERFVLQEELINARGKEGFIQDLEEYYSGQGFEDPTQEEKEF